MHWRTPYEDFEQPSMSTAPNSVQVVPPISTSSSHRGTCPNYPDMGSINQRDGRKSVSFDEDSSSNKVTSSVPSTMHGEHPWKSKRQLSCERSPSSIRTAPTYTSDDGCETPSSSSGPTVITLEHTVKQRNGSKWLRLLLKPSMIIAGGVIMLLTGGTAFFFTRWLTIPGLHEQIERLKAEVAGLELQVDELEIQVDRLGEEVDRLGIEVDRLAQENDRFSRLNDELQTTVAAYARENDRLNASLAEYEELNSELNSTVGQLFLIIAIIEDQNADLNVTALQLNTTATQLGLEIDRLEMIADDLVTSNRELKQHNEDLSSQTTRLEMITDDLTATVETLGDEIAQLSFENKRLASLNADLILVVSFLNTTAIGIQATYDDITEFLSEQILAYRVVAVETLENLYMQRISRWDCDFQSYFMTEAFATDRTLPIGEEHYADALEYVDERVLSELCLDVSDFERFVEDSLGRPEQVTANQLFRSVSFYTSNALAYYFPSGNNSGITNLEWSEAEFRCEELPGDRWYRH